MWYSWDQTACKPHSQLISSILKDPLVILARQTTRWVEAVEAWRNEGSESGEMNKKFITSVQEHFVAHKYKAPLEDLLITLQIGKFHSLRASPCRHHHLLSSFHSAVYFPQSTPLDKLLNFSKSVKHFSLSLSLPHSFASSSSSSVIHLKRQTRCLWC